MSEALVIIKYPSEKLSEFNDRLTGATDIPTASAEFKMIGDLPCVVFKAMDLEDHFDQLSEEVTAGERLEPTPGQKITIDAPTLRVRVVRVTVSHTEPTDQEVENAARVMEKALEEADDAVDSISLLSGPAKTYLAITTVDEVPFEVEVPEDGLPEDEDEDETAGKEPEEIIPVVEPPPARIKPIKKITTIEAKP